ncbi:MAG TPA: peptidylprolyl isomerase [Syntrophales bacterium]|nr:peptidylprolyl isomerase [Syntrophales bacterium]
MIDEKCIRTLLIVFCLVVLALGGCGSKDEKQASIQTETQKEAAPRPEETVPAGPPLEAVGPSGGSAVVIDVDGSKLTQAQMDAEIKKIMSVIKKQVPPGRIEQAKENARKQVLSEFTGKTLLANEEKRLNITASDEEVKAAVEEVKNNLPKGMTLEDLMKKNKITKEEMQEDLRFRIKINKLIMMQMSGKSKPTEKEIDAFYQKNKDRFKMSESVHVRHILVAKAAADDDKTKAEKKAKAEDLRRQLLAGADFAELAKKNSDCPSKETGGDLGVFTRGEMVKQFENAAFSQEVNAIGPVVETEYGFHIIQVLERHAPKILALDDRMKGNISILLEQQKQQETFDAILKKLRAKAKITVYRK